LDATHTTGRIASITLPTSGKIVYTYSGGSNGINCSDGSAAGLTRALQSAPPATEGSWTYTRTANGANWNIDITDPAGNHSVLQFAILNSTFYEVLRQVYQGSVSSNNLLSTVTTCYNGSCNNAISSGVRQLDQYTQPAGATSSARKKVSYNASGLATSINEWDYGATTACRITVINYAAPGNGILDHPSDTTVTDGAGNWLSRTVVAYDETGVTATSGVPNHDYTNHGSTFTQRGNATTVKRWVSGTTYIATTNTYDDLGNLRSSTDAGGHQTTYDYTDSYNDNTNHSTQAFVTTITLPSTGSPAVAHTLKNKFYWPSGMLYQASDQNAQVTAYTYDNMLRILTASNPDGGQITYSYPNSQQTQVQRKIDATNLTNEWTEVDGFGRSSRSAVANGESSPFDQMDRCYDPVHQTITTSYLYQGSGIASGPNGSKQCASSASDVFAFDALGRNISLTHADGTSTITTYNGKAVQVQDEGNGSGTRVTHVYQQDGLGRTVTVCELAGSIFGIQTMPTCGLDLAGSSTGVTTSYQYDALNRLTQVSQGSLMARQLTYDGISHLLSEIIPEAGGSTTTYQYNTVGLLASRTRISANQAASCLTQGNCATSTTTYGYDELNRLTSKTYSDAASENTPNIVIAFDESWDTYANGNMTSTWINDHTGHMLQYDWFRHDKMGRVTAANQTLPNDNAHGIYGSYAYNLMGGITNNAFSSDLTGPLYGLGYSYNIAGRPTQVTSSLNDSSHPGTLFQAAHYNAGGQLLSDSLGNGVNETFSYDARWRLLSASAVKGANTLYSLGGPGTGNTMTYAPDSGLAAANDSANGNWTFSYDALGRIAGANNSGGTNFNFDIDRNANRWHQNPSGQGAQLSFDATTNHVAAGNRITYDAAGNIINDGTCTYTYDAEYRITSVGTCSTASYVYDALGRRVRKTVGSSSTDYFYDISGNKVAELQGSMWLRMDFYAAESHLGSYQGTRTYFSHQDWLGTERVRTNDAGAIAQSCTSNPYGDNWTCTSGGYTTQVSFAGMELDNETLLYHTPYRYYNPRLGLWMTPDPAGMAASNLGDPQSLNRYTYVGGDPINRFDPTGLLWGAEALCLLSGDGSNAGKCGGIKTTDIDGSPSAVGLLACSGTAFSAGTNVPSPCTPGCPAFLQFACGNSGVSLIFRSQRFYQNPQQYSVGVGLTPCTEDMTKEENDPCHPNHVDEQIMKWDGLAKQKICDAATYVEQGCKDGEGKALPGLLITFVVFSTNDPNAPVVVVLIEPALLVFEFTPIELIFSSTEAPAQLPRGAFKTPNPPARHGRP
jgi:RHS repeat-associated protein